MNGFMLSSPLIEHERKIHFFFVLEHCPSCHTWTTCLCTATYRVPNSAHNGALRTPGVDARLGRGGSIRSSPKSRARGLFPSLDLCPYPLPSPARLRTRITCLFLQLETLETT